MASIIHQDPAFVAGQLDVDEFARFPEAPDWDWEVSLEDRMILEYGSKLHGFYLFLTGMKFNGVELNGVQELKWTPWVSRFAEFHGIMRV